MHKRVSPDIDKQSHWHVTPFPLRVYKVINDLWERINTIEDTGFDECHRVINFALVSHKFYVYYRLGFKLSVTRVNQSTGGTSITGSRTYILPLSVWTVDSLRGVTEILGIQISVIPFFLFHLRRPWRVMMFLSFGLHYNVGTLLNVSEHGDGFWTLHDPLWMVYG